MKESQKAYSLSRDILRKHIGYRSDNSSNVFFVNIPIGDYDDYTYIPAIVKEINEDGNEIKVKILSPSFYPLPLERVVSDKVISSDPLSFLKEHYVNNKK